MFSAQRSRVSTFGEGSTASLLFFETESRYFHRDCGSAIGSSTDARSSSSPSPSDFIVSISRKRKRARGGFAFVSRASAHRNDNGVFHRSVSPPRARAVAAPGRRSQGRQVRVSRTCTRLNLIAQETLCHQLLTPLAPNHHQANRSFRVRRARQRRGVEALVAQERSQVRARDAKRARRSRGPSARGFRRA